MSLVVNLIGQRSQDVILFSVPLDDRANDLLTTTSVTQATSDVYDNNSGSTTAAKILALFSPDLDLSLR